MEETCKTKSENLTFLMILSNPFDLSKRLKILKSLILGLALNES